MIQDLFVKEVDLKRGILSESLALGFSTKISFWGFFYNILVFIFSLLGVLLNE